MKEEENKKMVSGKEDVESNKAKEQVDASNSLEKPDSPEVPTPDSKEIMEFAISSMQHFGPMPNPITEKLTEGHIDKLLDSYSKRDDRVFADWKESRRFGLIYVVLFIAVFLFLTVFLVSEDTELYQEVIKILVTFFGGFGSGIGVKSYLDRGR